MAISVSTNIIQVTYKPNARFLPQGIRDAVAQVDADVVRLQVIARGRIEKQGTDYYLVAGKDRFLLSNPPAAPGDMPVLITGTVDDSPKLYKLKIIDSKPLPK